MNYKIVIIGILLGGFAIIGASIYVGYSVRDVEVVDNAYESGLKFDAQRKEEARLGWRVELPHEVRAGEPSGIVVMVKDREGKPLTGASVEVDLSMMGKRTNTSYLCAGGTEGRYETRPTLQQGYWDAVVRVSKNSDSATFNEIISVVR